MNDPEFEALLRRIMREEIEQAYARAPVTATDTTRRALLAGMKSELRAFFAQELGMRISEATIRRSAEAIAESVINHFTEFCNSVLLPTIAKKVQEAVDPYFRYVDQLLQRYEDESDWWKQNADESNAPEGESTEPGKERPNRGKTQSLDHELMRDMFRDEVDRTLRLVVTEVWVELYGRWGLGSDAFIKDLDALPSETEESTEAKDYGSDIPF